MSQPVAASASLCLLPRLEGLGGPASFRGRLSAALIRRGWQVHQNPDESACRAILVIAGTRDLPALWRARRRGVRIVQRLDGMNWLHRRRFTGVRHFLRSELNNALLAYIRRFLADAVVYQSEFSRRWWERVYGRVEHSAEVIYNAVDLQEYSPQGVEHPPADRWRLLVVEGHLHRGNWLGLENALVLARQLDGWQGKPAELWVAGDVAEELRRRAEELLPGKVRWLGIVPRRDIPALDRSAHLLFSAELNPPCPNAVIEALACGLPVAGFAEGGLPELVGGDGGVLAPWGSDVWKLQTPLSRDALAESVRQLLIEGEAPRRRARARAERLFDLETMAEGYLRVLLSE